LRCELDGAWADRASVVRGTRGGGGGRGGRRWQEVEVQRWWRRGGGERSDTKLYTQGAARGSRNISRPNPEQPKKEGGIKRERERLPPPSHRRRHRRRRRRRRRGRRRRRRLRRRLRRRRRREFIQDLSASRDSEQPRAENAAKHGVYTRRAPDNEALPHPKEGSGE
jgi:hypothetical protein